MGRRGAVAIVVVFAVAAVAWMLWPEGEEGAIRRQLHALVDEANERDGDALGTIARGARLSAYFTEDVVVDLAQGTEPVSGRQTLIGMAAHLQPRTATLVIALEDITVAVRTGTAIADVSLTATFRRRDITTREQTTDAREFALEMRKEGSEWRIARAAVVDTLK